MAYKSEDIKKLNSIHLLNQLYPLQNATMAELVSKTNFSQSSVRSILKDLESKHILVMKTTDPSTGGRCPGRYTFVEDEFYILSIFIDEGTVEVCLKDIFEQVLLKEHWVCEMNEALKDKILHIVDHYSVSCISIASSGVIEGDYFYTDQGEYMTRHDLVAKLKEELSIPIVIENDVKAMMMGIRLSQQETSLAYIYMSQTGVGSAYYTNDHILRGHQSFSGELGLIPYQGKSINEWIACQPSLEVLEDIYAFLLIHIAVTIDPQKVIMSGKTLPSLSIERIQEKARQYLSKRYQLNISISLHPLEDGLNGLHYLGILKLFDLYTDYAGG